MRIETPHTFSHDRCAATRRLRERARRAEAQAREAQDAAQAAVARAEAEAAARIAAAEAALAKARAEIKAERTALTELMESPGWARDFLVFARDEVRAELLELAKEKKSCSHCGSYGRAFYAEFLKARIDAMTDEHGLDPVEPLGRAFWPANMGCSHHKGRRLDPSWHDAPEPNPARRSPYSW